MRLFERRPAQPNAVLHVGASKCGSSALQGSLTARPELTGADGVRYEYVCVGRDGRVLRGDALRRAALETPYAYCSSAGLDPPHAWRHTVLPTQLGLVAPLRRGHRLILSSESWLRRPHDFTTLRLLPRLGVLARVVAYVRPPLDWINSAWWQWGAWEDTPFETWLPGAVRRATWANHLDGWDQVPGVASLEPRLATTDVLADFGALLTVDLAPTGRANRSAGAPLLRLLQRHPHLRPHPHDPQLEFALHLWSGRDSGPTPWVLTPDHCRAVLDQLRPAHERLARRLPPDLQATLRDDPRWWDPAAYADREPTDPHPPSHPQTPDEALAVQALEALLHADRAARAPLRSTWTSLTRTLRRWSGR